MTHNRAALAGILSILLCECIFGTSFLFIKQVIGEVPALFLLGWRFALAFLLLTLLRLARVIRLDLSGKPVKELLLVGLLQPVGYFLCETNGVRLTSASESGVIIACFPVVLLTMSALVLRERPSRGQIAGVVLSMTGVVLTVLVQGASVTGSLPGYALLAAGMLSYSLYTVYIRRLAVFSSAEITYCTIGVGAAVFSALALLQGATTGSLPTLLTLPVRNPSFLVSVVYLAAASSVLAFILYNTAVASIGPNRTATFVGVATVVSILTGVLIAGEPFTLWQGVGAVLILAGVYWANSRAAQAAA